MSEEVLKDYLRKQARSFDSLLELTPAQNMFPKDNSDQWQRKKQTPEQKKAAKMAKLDPANWKSAKDVYDERSVEAAKKRKRETEGSEVPQDSPSTSEKPAKKQKSTDTSAKTKHKPTEKLTQPINHDQLENKNLKKRAKKRAAQREKNELKRQRKEQEKEDRRTGQTEASTDVPEVSIAESTDKKTHQKAKTPKAKSQIAEPKSLGKDARVKTINTKAASAAAAKQETGDEDENEAEDDDEADWSDMEGDTTLQLAAQNSSSKQSDSEADDDVDMDDAHSTASSSDAMPDIMSPPQDSAASSVSSVLPPAKVEKSQPPKVLANSQSTEVPASIRPIQTEADRQAARERLQEQISQFRSQRKADDKPVRSRADLLAQRREKEQEKKQLKKEQRRKEKEEEARRQDEEIARRFSPGGSGSLLASPRSPMIDEGGSNAFSFGRIAFEDGSAFDPSKNAAADQKKHKGPADPATALKAAQAKQARVSGLDEQKRKDIEEKDMWLKAKKKAHGERVKDDTSLLKKALKRQEKQKHRSEKDWNERTEGVRSSQEARQKKRTDNLQKRKDDKLSRKVGGGKKKVKRPGFEGSFRGRSGKGSKK